jgi:hypothetical protein
VLFHIIALFGLVALNCVSALAEPAAGREWFVRAGSEGGDGSQAKPFADPWQPLEKCEAGDVIHIAGGKYFGKLNAGTWVIPFDNVQLIGGYDKDFEARDPWTNRTEFCWDTASKNPPREARVKSLSKNNTIDGIVIDMKDSSSYIDETKTSRREKPIQGDNALDFSFAVTIRNCVIINPDGYAISAPPGSTIENNLILNAIVFGVSIYTNTGDFKNAVATIKNNTILFTWGFKEPGKGAYDGACIRVNGPCNITGNILAHSDSHSIYQTYMTEKVSLTKNVFHQNLFSNLKCFIDGKDIIVDDKSMGDLEEMDLKAFEGNEILDPGLAYDPAWLDLYSRRTAYVPGNVTMDDVNKLRQLAGLPLIAKGGTPALGVAPAYDLDKALDLLTPKNEKCKAGARKIKLESMITGVAAASPVKTYPKGELSDWYSAPAAVNGKEMEMVVAMGGVANVSSMPAQYKDKILGFRLYDKEGKGNSVTGFVLKGSAADRLCNANYLDYQGRGKPETLFVVRGIAYEVQNVPKGAFFIETMERFEPTLLVPDARPKGRDWFVVMGATGGDGSKEKPFRDPWQALEKCEAGDSIHVAEGEYYGKLKIGQWKIDTTFISLIGGYDKEFKERNPWTHPTLLFCPLDFKGTMRGGYMVYGEGDHTGAVVDGFIFDKKTVNKYFENGDIDRDRSDAREHLWLFYPDIVIRNCVFLNGRGGALRVSNGATIENNIFINHMDKTIVLTKGHTAAPATIRNNTLMFSWETKFGEGRGRGGHLLRLESDTRAIVDNNVFEFADNDAVQLALTGVNEIVLTNNVFSHNLWSAVQQMTQNVVVDASNFKQLADLGFKKCEGNELLSSGCPVDEKFFDVYLNRTAYVPGKVTEDEWNQFRELLGQPVISTGGKGPEGFMPLYDWKSAIQLVPKNVKCKAGARPAGQTVKFEGVERKEETFEYAESSWDVAKNRDAWDKLDGKRVWLKVAIKPVDNQYQLDDIKKEEYQAFHVSSPDDSGGLPMRCYVKKGTRFERVMKNAKDFATGKPEESYIIKGIARQNRNMVVESIERAD